MTDFSEPWLHAEKAMKTAIAQAALLDWDGAEASTVAALAFMYDFKLAVIHEKSKAHVA